MAPLVKELESRTEIQSICCITAQHRQMLDDVLGLFAITPDYDLDIMEDRQSLYTITSKCLLGLEQVFSREKLTLMEEIAWILGKSMASNTWLGFPLAQAEPEDT